MWRPRFRSRLNRLRRYRHIMAVLMKYGLEEVAAGLRSRLAVRLGRRASPLFVKRAAVGHSRATRLRLALEEMGPTFIKVGQLLSTRPDLVPPEYIAELERLQDHVKPEDSGQICAEIERQLGGSLMELFRDFDCSPLAAGSIAQVHRAVLPDGTEVVVKVRRPRIVPVVAAECQILEELAEVLKATLFEHHSLDLPQMAKELTAAVIKETDLANERRNLIRFAKAFADDPTIHIPKVYESHCSLGVLTMEYIDGLKIGPAAALKAQGVDPKLVARRGADFVLRQVFEMGFFHTDPHPGNFFILPGNVLAPIDFGQVAALPPKDRYLVNEIILAMAGNEPRRIIKALDRQDMLDERTDVTKLTSEIEQLMEAYDHVSVWDVPFGQIISKVLDLFRIHHVRPPSQFTMMLKTLVTIESLAKSLDSDFNIMEVLTPYAEKSVAASLSPKRLWEQVRDVLQRFGDLAFRFPDDATTILRNLRQGKVQVHVHHEHLESLTKTLDRSSNRISFSLIIAALLVASSLLVPQKGEVLGLFALQTLGIIGYICAAIFGIWLLISILRSGRL